MKVIYFILFFTNVLLAQQSGVIEGKIVSADKVPLKNITIKLSKNLKKTDENGKFRFENFPIGSHNIVIEADGLEKQSQEVMVYAGQTSYVNIVLKEKIASLNEVLIIIKDSPNKKRESILSGLDIKPLDLPQSVQIIGNQIISQQQAIRMSDVIKNANGVYVGSARGGAQESFWSRGYDMTANNMFKNGFRTNGGYMPEVASLEKVEILKGNSALFFGNVTPGGVLNMVTKKPIFKTGGEISFQAGSYDFYKPTIDVYGPLNQSIAYRLVATHENSKSFRDFVERKRWYINPSLLFNITQKTSFLVQADALNDYWTPDFGTAAIGQTIIEQPRNLYLGAKWSTGTTKQNSVSGLLKHAFTDKWKLNFNTSYQFYDRAWEGTERIQPTTNGTLSRQLGKQKASETIFTNQLNTQICLHTNKIKHQIFGGIDYDNIVADNYTYIYTPSIYDVINIYAVNYDTQREDIPLAKNTLIVTTTTDRSGIFLQDLITFSPKIKAILGIRYSWQEVQLKNNDLVKNTITEDAKQKSTAFSPKFGFVYQPNKNMSLFGTYSNSFLPNTGVTIYNETLKPSIIDQYEAGIKTDFFKNKLSANLTFYTIINSNLAQTAEFTANGTINTNTNIKTLSGETTSKGFELDLSAAPLAGLSIMAGYSFNNMYFTKTPNTFGSFIEGERLTRTPKHTANFSAFYTIQKGLFKNVSFGTIAQFMGERLGGWNNTVGQTLPDRRLSVSGYTTIDASIGFEWKKFSFLCKLSNITNELNYTVHENYSMNPIAPRQVMGTIKYNFF